MLVNLMVGDNRQQGEEKKNRRQRAKCTHSKQLKRHTHTARATDKSGDCCVRCMLWVFEIHLHIDCPFLLLHGLTHPNQCFTWSLTCMISFSLPLALCVCDFRAQRRSASIDMCHGALCRRSHLCIASENVNVRTFISNATMSPLDRQAVERVCFYFDKSNG